MLTAWARDGAASEPARCEPGRCPPLPATRGRSDADDLVYWTDEQREARREALWAELAAELDELDEETT